MLAQINRIKLDSIFKKESVFFKSHKEKFTRDLVEFLVKKNLCKDLALREEEIASNFYESLFYHKKELYSRHLCWLKKSPYEAMQFFNSLMYELIEDFILQNKTKNKNIHLIKTLNSLQKSISRSILKDEEVFDVAPYIAKEKNISYLHNMYKLGRDIRFITHSKFGTVPSMAKIVQIGYSSVVIQVSSEQLAMLKEECTSFIVKNHEDEKNFSTKTKILCSKDTTVLLSNIKELDTSPLLSRKYPRASIIHASLVHIANENEYITGNMLDISEGGIGVMSSDSGNFQKGQDIVAFISYEDEEHNFKFSFETNGIITSIIGKKSAFRYGVQLFLNEKEREIVSNLVNILNRNKKEESKEN